MGLLGRTGAKQEKWTFAIRSWARAAQGKWYLTEFRTCTIATTFPVLPKAFCTMAVFNACPIWGLSQSLLTTAF